MTDEDGSWPLGNARHERLAVAVAGGKTMQEAMAAEGYARPDKHAARFMRHPGIRARIDYLQHQVAEKLHVTVADIVRELDRAFDLAEKDRRPSAMVSAAMGKAKVLGLIAGPDKGRLKRIEEMTEDELDYVLGRTDDGASVH